MNISNKTKRSISVPLPGGKKLFLGPGKTGKITVKAAEHPPLVALLDAGDLTLDESSGLRSGGSSDSSMGRGRHDGAPTGNIRRTGDR